MRPCMHQRCPRPGFNRLEIHDAGKTHLAYYCDHDMDAACSVMRTRRIRIKALAPTCEHGACGAAATGLRSSGSLVCAEHRGGAG